MTELDTTSTAAGSETTAPTDGFETNGASDPPGLEPSIRLRPSRSSTPRQSRDRHVL